MFYVSSVSVLFTRRGLAKFRMILILDTDPLYALFKTLDIKYQNTTIMRSRTTILAGKKFC